MEDNPYRAPMFTEPPTIQASSLSEAEIRAFVGKNAGYYLRKWSAALDDSGRVKGFNWAAFLLSGLWLPYRKMYRIALILFSIIAAETVLEEIAVTNGFASERGVSALGRLVGLIVCILCGTFGNSWYLAHVQREIARIRALSLQEGAYSEALARRGGTNLLASLGLFVLFLLAMTMMIVAVEFFFSDA